MPEPRAPITTSKPAWEEQVIRIHTDNGWQHILSWRLAGSQFAVHPRLSEKKSFTVTHVPTGFNLSRALDLGHKAAPYRRIAELLAERVAARTKDQGKATKALQRALSDIFGRPVHDLDPVRPNELRALGKAPK